MSDQRIVDRAQRRGHLVLHLDRQRRTARLTGAARTLTRAVEGAVVKPVADALKLTGTTRAVVAVGLGVGLTAGAVTLLCPAWVAAVLTAGAGASAVAAAHVGAAMNRLLARFRLA